jgi:hypothetical protein
MDTESLLYLEEKPSWLLDRLRIGAVMLFGDAVLAILLLLLILAAGEGIDSTLVTTLIFDFIFGINMWLRKESWGRYTIWRAVLGLIIVGGGALSAGDTLGLIAQTAFSGALILLLVGERPSRGRSIASIATYLLGYLGFILTFLTLSFLAGFFEAV